MALTTYEQLRASHVKRWHIVQTANQQSLAEHTYNVTVIAGSLAAGMRWPGLLHDSERLKLVMWAMNHDLIEVRTGDMPTPFKRALEEEGGKKALEDAEDRIDSDQAAKARMVKGTPIEMIVKLSDQIEAVWWLADNGLGQHAIEVLDGLRQILSSMVDDYENKYPDLRVREAVREVCAQINVSGGWL